MCVCVCVRVCVKTCVGDGVFNENRSVRKGGGNHFSTGGQGQKSSQTGGHFHNFDICPT